MAYKYYEEKIVEVHYLFGNEVAAILAEYFGIVSETGSAAIRMTEAILNDMETGRRKLYYNTRTGLRRVYPMAGVLIKELQLGISPYLKVEQGKHLAFVGEKKYKYQVLPVSSAHNNFGV